MSLNLVMLVIILMSPMSMQIDPVEDSKELNGELVLDVIDELDVVDECLGTVKVKAKNVHGRDLALRFGSHKDRYPNVLRMYVFVIGGPLT